MSLSSLRIVFFGCALVSSIPAWAVYAPIPESEQGKELSYALRAGMTYDTNIFGSATLPTTSLIFEVAPKITANISVTKEMFFSGSYEAVVDQYKNRPGKKTLDSHYLEVNLARSFSKTSTLYLSDNFSIIRNPESLLNGIPLNSDQSYESNSASARFSYAPTELISAVLKANDLYYHYLNATLGNQLDHNEDLLGAEGDYSLSEDLKAAGEVRHQDVIYAHGGSTNDKYTEFAMAGADYKFGPKSQIGFRLGGEWRSRSGASSVTTPYAELTGKYTLGKESFVGVGYTYDHEESSDVVHYTDSKVNRFFANFQHPISALLIASASLDYEPSTLLGRAGQPNVREISTRGGLGLSYIPRKNWMITANYDYDFVNSQVFARGLNRSRSGLSGRYSF